MSVFSLTASLVLYCLQLWAAGDYAVLAGAYGIITRLMTFTFLPLIGLGVAYQTILGNNFGAGLRHRANRATVVALVTAFVYAAVVQLLFWADAVFDWLRLCSGSDDRG